MDPFEELVASATAAFHAWMPADPQHQAIHGAMGEALFILAMSRLSDFGAYQEVSARKFGGAREPNMAA